MHFTLSDSGLISEIQVVGVFLFLSLRYWLSQWVYSLLLLSPKEPVIVFRLISYFKVFNKVYWFGCCTWWCQLQKWRWSILIWFEGRVAWRLTVLWVSETIFTQKMIINFTRYTLCHLYTSVCDCLKICLVILLQPERTCFAWTCHQVK